jgi:hypothetical protein
MTGNFDLLCNPTPHLTDVIIADGSISQSTHIGSVHVQVFCKYHQKDYTIELQNCLCVPGFRNTLWSVPAFAQSGHRIIFDANIVRIILNAEQPNQLEIHIAPPFAHQSQISYDPHMAFANTAAQKQPDSTSNLLTASNASPPRRRVDLELLHARLGHQSIKSLLAASHDSIWEDTQIRFAPDSFCISCKIATRRTVARGHRPVSHPEYPGQIVFMDLIHNPSQTSITTSTYFPYYLMIVCAYSRYGVLLGCYDSTSKSIITCIKNFSVYHRPHQTPTHYKIWLKYTLMQELTLPPKT